MKFSLVNLGCKVNRVEADTIGAALLAAGWERADSGADVAIVNTCTVTAEADRKTRKEVNRAVARNPQACVMVTGCAATIEPEVYEALSPRVRVVAKNAVVQECFALAGASYEHAPAVLRVGEAFPTRVGIKVQDGCNNACTFCIVHVARGKATSLPLAQCISEVKRYAAAGVREVVLTGIDLGAYCDGGAHLSDLVRSIRKAAPELRLRISSIEPHTIDDDFIALLVSEDGMVCRHLHMPLQSGSSKVLHDMARHYNAEGYLRIVEKLRAAVPELSLSTDVIVGFPGEADEDFQQTIDLAQACGFSKMHLFRYSKRAGTPAALRHDQVEPACKTARMERLAALAEALRRADAKRREGTQELVLVESLARGMSESYYEVKMPAGASRGSLIACTLQTFEKDGTFSL